MNILVLNGGSSSLKCSLYRVEGEPPSTPGHALWEAHAEWHGLPGEAHINIKTDGGKQPSQTIQASTLGDVAEKALTTIWEGKARVLGDREEIHVTGHRIVHGGSKFEDSTLLTDEVRDTISKLSEIAPVHNPPALAGIDTVDRLLGKNAKQVAVFDTAFHRTLPRAAYVYPGPYEWLGDDIRKYGFHGISHQYVSRRAAELLGQNMDDLRMITCHLGNGCSLAAVLAGKSVETTMGFTPLDGVMMGTRSGSVDPGILIHLLHHGASADTLDRALNKESGLKGISGISEDLRQVTAAADSGNERAKLAIDVYVHRLRAYICSMLPALGGLDALVFTGGVGENSSLIRRRTCEGLEFLGVSLDLEANSGNEKDRAISAPQSKVKVLIVDTQEEWEVARECARLSS